MDLWLKVENDEIHRVSSLLPTLSWSSGILGVRIALEPENLGDLYRDFRTSWKNSDDLKKLPAEVPRLQVPADAEIRENPVGERNNEDLLLWPGSLTDFLTRRLDRYFTLRRYPLDPTKLVDPIDRLARPQGLSPRAQPLSENPLKHLIRIDEINAQRGLGDGESSGSDGVSGSISESAKLSRQLSSYYTRHLNPTELPDAKDIKALITIANAQTEFDKRLGEAFRGAILEMEDLGYPGITDPKILVSTRLDTSDSLNHESAVSFLVDMISPDGTTTPDVHLPEGHNGLGYQNLISMVFRLMSFRDAWMRVGKAGRRGSEIQIEPLHLVLVEEPEAHLHVQVQQVFIKKAFRVLRNHPDLADNKHLTTQLLVSTHSSHVSHELPFSSLRYFRRLPAGLQASVPTSSVVSLKNVFGTEGATQQFVTRYLRAHHADLFFADAVILVEGPAEKMLIPNFIRDSYEFLNCAYVSVLEIGGSHAHRLRPLIEQLQIPTLVITDIDASEGGKGHPVTRGRGQVTTNPTIIGWSGLDGAIDGLLDASESEKTIEIDDLFAVRFAYQTPVMSKLPLVSAGEALPSTFEDALAFQNVDFFLNLEGMGLVTKFASALAESSSIAAAGQLMFESLKTGKKAEFALDIMADEGFDKIKIPKYINDGLRWLENKLKKAPISALELVVAAEIDS